DGAAVGEPVGLPWPPSAPGFVPPLGHARHVPAPPATAARATNSRRLAICSCLRDEGRRPCGTGSRAPGPGVYDMGRQAYFGDPTEPIAPLPLAGPRAAPSPDPT